MNQADAAAAMRVFTASYLHIHYESALHSIELEWRDHTRGEELRVGIRRGIQLAQEHQVRAWIANMTHMHVICPEDQEWVKAEWLPRLRPLGIEFLALVISADALNRLGMHNIMDSGGNNGRATPETVYFSSVQDARDWVRQACQAGSPARVGRRYQRR
ncbi:MAG: hypothetical protein H7Z21_16920 [Hymenobacter sp.]|nr:hypothetical protein [Hymenobacter sp.]